MELENLGQRSSCRRKKTTLMFRALDNREFNQGKLRRKTTTSENNDPIGEMRKNNRAARACRGVGPKCTHKAIAKHARIAWLGKEQ